MRRIGKSILAVGTASVSAETPAEAPARRQDYQDDPQPDLLPPCRDRMKHDDLSRAEQMAEAVKLVHGLLGERPASKVQVEITRGGTYRIVAETGNDAPVVKNEWRPKVGRSR